MSEYHKEFRELSREVYWTGPRVAMWGFFGAILVGLLGWLASVILVPTQIFDPRNVKMNYEFFHDVSRDQAARVRQIAAHRALIKDTTDGGEIVRLRLEVTGMQHSCRELVARYNSRATQIHRGLFQGSSVPATLDAATCE